MHWLILFCLLTVPVTATAQKVAPPEMQVQVLDARLPATASGHNAIFSGVLHNPTSQTLVITGASSPLARQVMFQRYGQDASGFRALMPLEQITLLPGAEVIFAPGGLEMVLIGMETPLESGMETPLVLQFQGGFKRNIRLDIHTTHAQ